jgi:hypothetical protein
VLQGIEPDGEADLVVFGLKPCGIANAGNRHAANGDHVIDRVREDRTFSGGRKDAHGENGARRVLRTREREEIADIGRGVANRPRTVNMIGHREPPSSA